MDLNEIFPMNSSKFKNSHSVKKDDEKTVKNLTMPKSV